MLKRHNRSIETIDLPWPLAVDVAKFFSAIAVQYGLDEIKLSKEPTKSELEAALLRGKDIERALKKHGKI